MDASRRGDDRGKEGVTQGVARVASPIFLNLHPSPLIEREINVLMEQGAIQRGVVRAAMEVVHCGDVNRDSPKISNAHVAVNPSGRIGHPSRVFPPWDVPSSLKA